MRKVALFMNGLCFVMALVSLSLSVWQHDWNQIGAWCSASCGWALALMYSLED